jgi:glycine hydroxymethyltransferase
MQPSFREYQHQVVRNARRLAQFLANRGLRLVSGGTDNHLMLVDLTSAGISGKDAATALDKAAITVNKNTIPFDTQSPFVTSGIRLGTPACTTRGMKEREMDLLGGWICDVISHPDDAGLIGRVRGEVLELCGRFPIP